MKNVSLTLLVSTYNWPEALEMVLLSILKQTVMPNEILIADDGSDDRTKDIINTYKHKIEVPVKHVWHEDKGFRKSAILNKSVAISKSDYIIQVDGDCILHPQFIEDHKNNIEEGLYLFGTRVRIKKQFVKEVTSTNKICYNFFSKVVYKRPRAIRLPVLSNLFKKHNSISPKFRGCNTSYWKNDFTMVNGYNEDIEGWGKEDSELMIRLHNNEIKAKRLKFCGIVYHLDHLDNDKSKEKRNIEVQDYTLKNKVVWAENGLDKYL